MSLRDIANITLALAPFTGDPEIHRFTTDRYHVGFRADRHYFATHPRMNYAIRRALNELDSLAEFSACPPPSLYVLVIKVDDETHVVERLFRGEPDWRQVYCGQFLYADVHSDQQAIELTHRCRANGGMNDMAREQFEHHNGFVTLMREFATRETVFQNRRAN